jgi:hypothetical protein
MVAVLECNTEDQRSLERFWAKDSVMQGIFMKKCFLFMLGSVCRVKRFHLGGKLFADNEEVESEVRKWLRQLSKNFHAEGFGRTGKAMGPVY